MPPRSTPPPKYPQNDVATYRDLLLFEERLKSTAASLQHRKSRYQLFLVQLLLVIAFLLVEVLLPPHVSLIAIPCKLVLQRLLPDIYTDDTEVHIHPYFSTGLLFVSVTTLALFFASGTYSDKIAYANKYVPHANRALRSFNMYLNVRQPPLRSKIRLNPLSFFFPRPAEDAPATTSSRTPSPTRGLKGTSASTAVPIPPMPPSTNPRGELRFSYRVDRAFRDGYERYRANFERRRAQQEQLGRTQSWISRWRWWGAAPPGPALASAGLSESGTRTARSGTPPVTLSALQKDKDRERTGTPPGTPRRQRSGSPLRLSIAERRSGTPPVPSLGRDRSPRESAASESNFRR